jgi:hypothetical protein
MVIALVLRDPTSILQGNRAGLKELFPVGQASYNPNRVCIPGTRVHVIDTIASWSQDGSTEQRLLWVYGFAGLGKSSIAASVCQRLEEKNVLAASFFCKRDDPELRDPERLLNTIVYGLASQHRPYELAVAKAIQNDLQLCTSHIQRRYKGLVQKPLEGLGTTPPAGTLVVVVDALDECEKGESRGLVLTCLRDMCQLVPWLKVIITSRPDEDIKATFGQPNNLIAMSNIADYNASDDIHTFVRTRMAEIAKVKRRAEWPEEKVRQLADHASGLFIWAETACKFIAAGIVVDDRLEQTLMGIQPGKGSHPLAALDALYGTAIRNSMGDDQEDNRTIVRQCIGAIVATSRRTPLSAPNLEALLLDEVQPGVICYVVNALGSVLYEDGGPNGPIRVCHPSFEDYVTDPARSGDFHVDMHQQNTMLAGCCFRLMLQKLKFNICGLETSHKLNRDVAGLDRHVREMVGEDLRYSCVYWSSHLAEAEITIVQNSLREFLFGKELLYWMEVLSLFGTLGVALSSLLALSAQTRDSVSNFSSATSQCY